MDKPGNLDSLEKTYTSQQIISVFIDSLRNEALRLREAAQRSFDISAQMDGKMQSRYDTQKEDHAMEGNQKLSDAIKLEDKITAFLERVEGGIASESYEIRPDITIFQLKDLNYEITEWFFLSDVAGGKSVIINGVKVTGISDESVLGSHALGKKKGEKIVYTIYGEEQRFKVITII